jgi:transposase-like protein
MGEGTIRIHDRKRERYRCTRCKQTFSARRGTMLEGLRKPTELIVIVVSLTSLWLSHPGHCPRVRIG